VARRYVSDVLTDVPQDVVGVVSLMVSELATNCVRHVDTDFTVSVEQSAHDVRVDVADGGGGTVTLRDAGPSEPAGHGLRIVQQFADDWGVSRRANRVGKSVWFSVSLQQ
jgi:anti-sigma regulatory factor (Ser/Thr protein kinase)